MKRRIYILMISIKKLCSFFLAKFSKRNRNMFSLFLLSYRNTCGSLGEIKKAVPTAFHVVNEGVTIVR